MPTFVCNSATNTVGIFCQCQFLINHCNLRDLHTDIDIREIVRKMNKYKNSCIADVSFKSKVILQI